MNKLDVLLRIFLSLGVLSRWVVLSGSASAKMHFTGFRRAGDLDFVGKPVVFLILGVFRLWGWKFDLPKNVLCFKEWRLVNDELNMEMFMYWRTKDGYIPYRELARRAYVLHGVQCVNTSDVLMYKRWLRRSKDILDIKRIVDLIKQVLLETLTKTRSTALCLAAPVKVCWETGYLDSS